MGGGILYVLGPMMETKQSKKRIERVRKVPEVTQSDLCRPALATPWEMVGWSVLNPLSHGELALGRGSLFHL